jgi:three-Cys-motif partner protein
VIEVLGRHVDGIRFDVVGRRANGERNHRFGGDWTTSKLKILGGYLAAYTQALKNQPFKTAYIDAFAGTGYRVKARKGESEHPLFALEEQGTQQLLDGSARVALKTDPACDRYIFIEKSRKRVKALDRLKGEFPDLADAIDVRHEEANRSIRTLCSKDWRRRRAVLFLDPYGMQVEWATIEAIGGTRAIDLWILFPLGIAVNRLLTQSGNIPPTWRRRLDLLLGPGWYDAFYKVEAVPTLFDDEMTRVVKATTATIGRYFNDRLASVFARVAQKPRVLVNSVGCPLYLLCFATGNSNGAPIALKIADHLLKAGEQ